MGVLWTDFRLNWGLANGRRCVKRGSWGPHIPYPLFRWVLPRVLFIKDKRMNLKFENSKYNTRLKLQIQRWKYVFKKDNPCHYLQHLIGKTKFHWWLHYLKLLCIIRFAFTILRTIVNVYQRWTFFTTDTTAFLNTSCAILAALAHIFHIFLAPTSLCQVNNIFFD